MQFNELLNLLETAANSVRPQNEFCLYSDSDNAKLGKAFSASDLRAFIVEVRALAKQCEWW